MQEMTLATLIAVFQEVFGPVLFWALVATVAVITAPYVYVLIRDPSLSMRRFLRAQLSMPIGAVAAVVFVEVVTDSHLRDIGGAIDVIVLLGVALLGAFGFAALVYTTQSLVRRQPQNAG
jgi:hypothetical protein